MNWRLGVPERRFCNVAEVKRLLHRRGQRIRERGARYLGLVPWNLTNQHLLFYEIQSEWLNTAHMSG